MMSKVCTAVTLSGWTFPIPDVSRLRPADSTAPNPRIRAADLINSVMRQYFDPTLRNLTKVETICANLRARLEATDGPGRMMAVSDLTRVAQENVEAVSRPPLRDLLKIAASSFTECPDRGVAAHAAQIFYLVPQAAREFLPDLLRYLEQGFPGRTEPMLPVWVIDAVEHSGIFDSEVERVLHLCAAKDPKMHRDEVVRAREALAVLTGGTSGHPDPRNHS